MKFLFNIVYVTLACSTFALAQHKGTPEENQIEITEILTQLENDIPPRKRIAKNLRLVKLYEYSHEDVDSLINVSLSLAEENNFLFFIAQSLKFRTRFRLYLNEDRKLIRRDIDRIDSISKFFKNKHLPKWVNGLNTQFYLDVGELDKVEQSLKEFKDSINLNPKFYSAIYHTTKGILYQRKRKYTKSIEEYNIALTKLNPGVIFINNNLAKLQLELNNPDQALKYINSSIRVSNENRSKIVIVESYIIKGDIYLSLKDTTEALKYYELAESIRSIPFYSKNYSALDRIVTIYNIHHKEKVDSLLSDISALTGIESYPMLLVLKGMRMIEKGNFLDAEKKCKLGLEKAKHRQSFLQIVKACDCLIQVGKHNRQDSKVVSYLEMKMKYQNLLNDDDEIVALARNLAKIESEKEKVILEQQFNKDQAVLKEKVGRYKLTALFIGLFLAFALYAAYQLIKRNKRIKSQNHVITKALGDKDILLREIHHRVKNNLQLISSLLTMQGRSIDDEVAVQAINDGRNRVRSMALIHQDLYNKKNLTDISVKDYVEKLSRELFGTYNVVKDRIQLQLNIDDLDIDIDTLVPLGLIINELLTNSLKYAFPDDRKGRIKVSLNIKDNDLVFQIADDGIGFDPLMVRDNAFGSTLISALTDQLEGVLSIDAELGTKVKIVIKDYC